MNQPRHLISSQDIDKAGYEEIMRRAESFLKKGIPPRLMEGKAVATLFFQPSTRTQARFQSAMIRSGGGWLGVSDTRSTSMSKGESLEDTVRTFSDYADIIVLRHEQPDATEVGAAVSRVPVINGGNGNKEHALGAGCMLFNIRHYLGFVEGAKVGFYGPAEFSRCAKGLLPILGYYGAKVFVDDVQGHFPFPKDVEEAAHKHGLGSLTYSPFEAFIKQLDWLVVCNAIPTAAITEAQRAPVKKHYRAISTRDMKSLRQDAWLDGIPPCVFEIERDVCSDPRTVFTKKEIHVEYVLALMTYLISLKCP